jgi:hypothetical protein
MNKLRRIRKLADAAYHASTSRRPWETLFAMDAILDPRTVCPLLDVLDAAVAMRNDPYNILNTVVQFDAAFCRANHP